MQFSITSEYGVLREVLLGSIRNFQLNAPINVTQQHYYRTNPPKVELLIEQEERFVALLQQHNVTVHQLPLMSTSFTQFFTRDIAAVIGNTLVVGAMKAMVRQAETTALEWLLTEVEQPILRADMGFLEGGDILVDGSTLYVGLGERTDETGLAFLEQSFGQSYEIIPLKLAATFLHLDVVLNILGKGDALIYTPALDASSVEFLSRRYRLIEVTAEEQFNLATNVLSLSPETIVVDERNHALNAKLASKHYEVLTLPFAEIGKMGGSFRCGTCPLRRA